MTLELEEDIILVKLGSKWVCRYWNVVMGEQPIGPG